MRSYRYIHRANTVHVWLLGIGRRCRASTKQPSLILSEVFNALMDMYGDEQVHAQVFDSLDVLGNFQRTLPRFKKRIQAERMKDEVEQWRETALNASRFISYKKGQL